MACKFNSSGELLAYHCSTYGRSSHDVIVMEVKNLKVTHKLTGHLNIVYDLDWLNEQTLITVSSDRTAIVWTLSRTGGDFSLKVCTGFKSKS